MNVLIDDSEVCNFIITLLKITKFEPKALKTCAGLVNSSLEFNAELKNSNFPQHDLKVSLRRCLEIVTNFPAWLKNRKSFPDRALK